MDRQQLIVELEFADVTERFVRHANEFLDRLSASDQLPPEDALPSKLIGEAGLGAHHELLATDEVSEFMISCGSPRDFIGGKANELTG